jgi:hypothetical protein
MEDFAIKAIPEMSVAIEGCLRRRTLQKPVKVHKGLKATPKFMDFCDNH